MYSPSEIKIVNMRIEQEADNSQNCPHKNIFKNCYISDVDLSKTMRQIREI